MRFLRKYAFVILVPLAVLLLSSFHLGALGQTPSTIQRQVVEYSQGGQLLEGYLAFDSAQTGPRPGVMVVHEWKGINDYTRRRADQLAEMGYIAFAADIYGKGIRPQTNEEAREQATLYRSNRPLLRDRANAGLNLLRNHPLSDNNRLAAIGYCFGGTTVLELARSGADLQGAVSFHGNLDTPNPQDAEQIQAKVLVLHGADDPLVPDTQVAAFQKEMRDAKVDWQLIAYGGAVHSFTNPDAGNDPSQGSAYNAEADRRSWEHMQQFFAEIFQD
ncbi:MAG: dienelactone hydrolase family protein [Desertifilum sp.]|nr:dienelactone hydrolase family protein [Desertifilum sp.]MDI9637708.1 dienelactone hydrolase family protein [Geitlerinema splendidum]